MDTDNAASEIGNGAIDNEQSFLQQFSCMGTTDKEELVQQLQKLLGSELNYPTAAFFLDMNNWNLQAAVCSYFDIDYTKPLPEMKLVADPFANENESVEPNLRFKKTWHICNTGNEKWPVNCYAQCSDGYKLGGDQVPIPSLDPGEGFHLTVDLIGPPLPAIYQSKWRLCTAWGAYFGDPMWVIVTVEEEGTVALTNQLSHFNQLGALSPPSITYNPFSPQQIHIGNNQDVAPPDGQKDPSML